MFHGSGEGYKNIALDNVDNKYVKEGYPEIHYGLGEKGYSPYLTSPEPVLLLDDEDGTTSVLIGAVIMRRIEMDHTNEELLSLILNDYEGLGIKYLN